MDRHAAMAVFVEVARAGGFSAAARRLNMSTTAVSRHVAELEAMLGVTLLRRTTRRVGPTEAGARYLPRAAAILEEIERLHGEISAADATPRGRLRVTAAPSIGHGWIAPLAIDFAEAYPEIRLDIEFAERVVDLVAEGFDAAIRSGPLVPSSLIGHRLIHVHYALCASPAYVARRGAPDEPCALADHDCIHWRQGHADGVTLALLRAGERVDVPVRGRLQLSYFPAQREAALRGLGVALLPLLDVRRDLAAGRLVRLLPDWEVPPDELSLVRPPTPFEPAKLRAFIDFITARLRALAGGRPPPRERENAASGLPAAGILRDTGA